MKRPEPSDKDSRRIGLARALSKLGYCSRSRAFELIRAGQVALNGTVRRDAEFSVRMASDVITVAGVRIDATPAVYLVMNKPRGIVTTADDEKGRRTVYDLIPPGTPWVGPVGRLDKASEGLLLLTNDSEWAARIIDPQSHLDKTYHVQIATTDADAVMARLTAGVRVSSGELLRFKHATLLRAGERNCWLEIVLDEGRNRQIRRVLEALGIEVLRLVRVRIGPLRLGDLAKSMVRQLTAEEKHVLDLALAASIGTRRAR